LKRDIRMKFIAAACLVAAAFAEPEAKAEADASVLYGAYGYAGYAAPYSLGYRGYAGAYGAYGAYPYAHSYGHYIGKRAAEAEPEADASVLYGSYGYARPYSVGYAGYAGHPYAYGAYPYAARGHYIGKRSAEADASVLYGAYGYAASPYTHGYAGYAAHPAAYGAYGAYPYTYGTRYLGKRSADAEPEADASVLYGAYGYAASPYSYGYSGYPRAYGAYPYAYSYLG